MINDLIADSLTRIRNAAMRRLDVTTLVHSKVVEAVVAILADKGYIESFNGRLRDECLNVEIFHSMPEVHGKLAAWRSDYNHHRPHSALGDMTPLEFVARHHCGPSPSRKLDSPGTGSVKGARTLDPAAPWPLWLRREGAGPTGEGPLCEATP